MEQIGNRIQHLQATPHLYYDSEQQAVYRLMELQEKIQGHLRPKKPGPFPNVLDSLTISQQNTHQTISEFSRSLVKSTNGREQERKVKGESSISLGSELKGPPRKTLRVEKSHRRSKSKEGELTFSHKQRPSASNLYTGREESHSQTKLGRETASKFTTYWKNSHASHRVVEDPSVPKVTARQDYFRRDVRSSPKDSFSFHSSQFSEKNNKHKINSVDSDARSAEQDQSGQFHYFEKDSDVRTDRKHESVNNKDASQSISFADSYDHSTSQYALDYGTDLNARIPNTLKKPKFSFQKPDEPQIIIPRDTRLIPGPAPNLIIKRKSSKQPILQGLRASPRRSDFEDSLHLKPPSPQESQSDKKSGPGHTKPFKFEASGEESSIYQHRQHVSPHQLSDSASLSSDQPPLMNFKEVYRATKKEKASVLASSRTLAKMKKLPNRKVQVADFKQLRDLENELGQLRAETKQFNYMLSDRQKELNELQLQREVRVDNDPFSLKKENELIKIMLEKQLKVEKAPKSPAESDLARQLRQSSIKNMQMNLRDYNPQVLKLKLMNTLGHSKQYRKQCVSNRCILLNNSLIEVGYSYKHDIVTLYFTLKHYCESLHINLMDNSIIFVDSIQRNFDKVYVGKQMKFKTQVKGTKDLQAFVPSILDVHLSFEHQLSVKTETYSCVIPLTPYNMAKALTTEEALFDSMAHHVKYYVTALYNSSEQLIRKGKAHLTTLFPLGQFSQEDTLMTLFFEWKGYVEKVTLKLKERAFRIEGIGHPTSTARQLIEAIINMLIDQRAA